MKQSVKVNEISYQLDVCYFPFTHSMLPSVHVVHEEKDCRNRQIVTAAFENSH